MQSLRTGKPMICELCHTNQTTDCEESKEGGAHDHVIPQGAENSEGEAPA
jgi:hypothetical protein